MGIRARVVGNLITLDEDVDLAIEIRIKNVTPSTAVLSVADAPYEQLGAGTYTPLGLVEIIGEKLRTWFRAACLGHGAPVGAPASKDNVSLFVDWVPTVGTNQTLAKLSLGSLGDTTLSGLQALTDYVKFKNTSDAFSLVGLIEEGAAADRTINATFGGIFWQADCFGLWQPPGIFCFARADVTRGIQPTFHDVFTHELRDGKVVQTLKGSPSYYDNYKIVDQKPSTVGPLYYVGEFSSIKANRKSVYLRAPKPSAINMEDPLYLPDKLVVGRYYMIGHSDPFLFRLASAPIVTATTIELPLFTKVPALLATPPSKSPVLGVPEAMALYLLSLQNGGLCIYDSNPLTGAANFAGAIYSIQANGELPVEAKRRDIAHPFYSLEFPLVMHGAPQVIA